MWNTSMAKICIVILSVTALLAAVCNAASKCSEAPELDESDADSVLEAVNKRRTALAQGTQKSGPDGGILPKVAIENLEWNCELAGKLQEQLNNLKCNKDEDLENSLTITTWTLLNNAYDYEVSSFGEAVTNNLDTIDSVAFFGDDVFDDYIKFTISKPPLKQYSNIMRSEATLFACARKTCEKDPGVQNTKRIYLDICGTDAKPLQVNDVIFYFSKATTGTTTTVFTTTITTAHTTTAHTTTAHSTTAPTSTTAAAAKTGLATTTAKGSSGTARPTASKTPCPTYSTTPCPTYPPARAKRGAKTVNAWEVFVKIANFPTATPVENTICSSNKGMTDSLRTLFLNMHNYRRAKLALGEVIGYDRERMPPARNMLKLSYACELEASAVRYAALCPSMRSKASARPNQGENFLRLAKVRFPGFADAVNMTVYNWWDVVRDTPGIDKNAKLQTRHLRSPIVTFAQMAWASTRYLGCALADCNSYYVSICRYSPKGNAIGEMVYKPGHTCSECKHGTTCEEELGLCV